MATIDVSGLNEVKAMIATLGDEMDQVNKLSQNKMAYQIWAAEKDQMKEDMDRPTPWSLGALRYKKSGVTDFDAPPVEGAAVYMANAFRAGTRVGPDEWLGVQIVGGQTAGPRRSERIMANLGWMPRDRVWVPAVGCPLDAYGNVRGSMISDMLTNLGANPYGDKADPSKETTKYILIGERGKEEGVFRKVNSQWVPFIWFVPRQEYRSRFDFHGRSVREVNKDYLTHISYYLDQAIRHMA